MKKKSEEEILQARCYKWFMETFPAHRQMLFHVQQKAMNAIEGTHFKALGVTRGISDLILVLPLRVIFIEMKIPDGEQSEDQIKFERRVLQRGHPYIIIDTFEDFKTFIYGTGITGIGEIETAYTKGRTFLQSLFRLPYWFTGGNKGGLCSGNSTINSNVVISKTKH